MHCYLGLSEGNANGHDELDGSYLYRSPRASILSLASLSAQVCMLVRVSSVLDVP